MPNYYQYDRPMQPMRRMWEQPPVTYAMRIALSGTTVTLADGRSATVSGTHNAVATITTTDGQSAELSWTVLARIVAEGGAFSF
jgi:hypothetical protein